MLFQPFFEVQVGKLGFAWQFGGRAIFFNELDFRLPRPDIADQRSVIEPLPKGVESEFNYLFKFLSTGFFRVSCVGMFGHWI